MGKITKIILVALYLIQVGVVFHEHVTHVFHQMVEAIRVPSESAVRGIIHHVTLESRRDAPVPNKPVLRPAITLAQLPVVLAAISHPPHLPEDGDGKNDKDRIRRHRRLHRFRGPERFYGNLFERLRNLPPPLGHERAYTEASATIMVFNGAQA